MLDGLSFKDLLPCLKFINNYMGIEYTPVVPRYQRLWGVDPNVF